MQYRYVKKHQNKNTHSTRKTRLPKFLPVILVVVGLLIVGNSVFPIAFYQLFFSPQFSQLLSPVAQTPIVLGETNTANEYVQASSWFPNAPKLPPRPSKITFYTISVPKLKIKEATVEIGGDDLKKSLVQYRGTALPGQFGNAVIFGHSSLPQFFSPTSYLSIFATLPSIRLGDEIDVNFDGITYKYVVENMFETKPDDISVLGQRYDDSYITLVTCVPPGTVVRRLVVISRLKII